MCLTDGMLQTYLDHELDAGARSAVVSHLDGCDRCRSRMAAMSARRGRIEDLLASASAAPLVCAPAALARFRAREGAAGGRIVPILGWRSWLATGAGAAAVTAAAIAWHSGPGPHPTTRTPAVVRPAASVAAPEAPRLGTGGAPQSAEARRPSAEAAARRAPASSARASSSTATYTPLVEGGIVPEVGMVVRVALPLSALGASPSAASGSQASDSIEADVLVGQDGRALAIRFVDQVSTSGRK